MEFLFTLVRLVVSLFSVGASKIKNERSVSGDVLGKSKFIERLVTKRTVAQHAPQSGGTFFRPLLPGDWQCN